jgi:hypothetical protein
MMSDGPYVVTAYKRNRRIKNAGLHLFGPFITEEDAQKFADKVAQHPDWQLEEIPVLNLPSSFGTGDERL